MGGSHPGVHRQPGFVRSRAIPGESSSHQPHVPGRCPAEERPASLRERASYDLQPFVRRPGCYIRIDIDSGVLASRKLNNGDQRSMAHTGKRRAKVHVRLSLPNGGSLDEADIALIENVAKMPVHPRLQQAPRHILPKDLVYGGCHEPDIRDQGHRNIPRPQGWGRGGDPIRSAHCRPFPVDRTPVFPGRCGRSRRAYGMFGSVF